MDSDKKRTKKYLMRIPPLLAISQIEEYQIPSPQKEVLIASCVKMLNTFPAIEWLKEEHGICMSQWQFGDRLQEGLRKFYETHTMLGRDFVSYLED